MRKALNNCNYDLVQKYPDYFCRVVSDEGDIGRGHLDRFLELETKTPVILTTSQLLTTGVDAQTCKNIVLFKVINSMVDFKQIIGRGTRVREDYGKLFFTILDYTGSATRMIADVVYELDSDGKRLAPIKYTDYTKKQVRSMYTSVSELRSKWSDAEQREQIVSLLMQKGITIEQLADATKKYEADPFDLLCHVAYNAPIRIYLRFLPYHCMET